jgi:hypothetical protein
MVRVLCIFEKFAVTVPLALRVADVLAADVSATTAPPSAVQLSNCQLDAGTAVTALASP